MAKTMDRVFRNAAVSFLINIAYSVYHIVFSIITHSWWMLTVGTYYAMLSIVRVGVLRVKDKITGHFILRFTGVMLMILALPLAGTVILSFVMDRGTKYRLVVMLALSVYAFSKITFAAINWAKEHKSTSARMVTLRNISFADAFVSIFSLQRSMLVTFEGMREAEIRIMNAATGSAVCIIVFLLGLNLLRHNRDHELRQ